MICKKTGESKNIVFGLTGTGYFDMFAYGRFNDGEMVDFIPTDEEIEKSLSQVPTV
jgi:tryptophan synthase beta chain